MENTIHALKDAKLGTPEWDLLEKIIDGKRKICEVYGVGTLIETPDGVGCVLTIHGRAVCVSLNQITSTQILHGFDKGNGGLQRTYLFKDFDCPLLLTPLSQITDEDYIEAAKILGLRPNHEIEILKGISQKQTVVEIFSHQSPKGLDSRKYLFAYQYLQSKGYLLPYMGLSTEELISRGWAKEREVK